MAQLTLAQPSKRSSALFGGLLGALALIGVAAVAPMALLYAPQDDFQGMTQRLFYIHVPFSWLAYLSVGVTAFGSLMVLARGSRWWDRVALASAELGVVFTTLSLITGSLWGRQIWGAWWVWDARITSTLVLWLIYVAYLMLRSSTSDSPRQARFAAALGLFGAVDIPIIHWSVTWWRTMHPLPIVIRDRPQLPAEMLTTLLVSTLAFTLLYVWLLYQRTRVEVSRDEVRELRQRLDEAD